MSILPPTYIRVELPFRVGLDIMLQQKKIHSERMNFYYELSRIQAKSLAFAEEIRGEINCENVGDQYLTDCEINITV